MSAVRLEGVSKLYASAPRIRPPRPIRKPGTLTKRLTVRGALDAALANHPRRNTPSDSVLALDDVSLNVQEDSIFVVMGLSGSGKSTLLRCVNMLSRPTSGKVFLGEEDLTQASDDRLREIRGPRIAMVFQHHALLPHRTVLSNVSFGLELLGVRLEERNHRALQALNLVQLDGWGERYPHELSGGMRQRVGLARALTTDADVLLLDEPFSGLDPLTRRELQIDLLRLQETLRRTMIFVTHDVSEAVTLGDRVAILDQGKVAQEGLPLDIVFRPETPYVRDFVAAMDKFTLLTVGEVFDLDCRSDCSVAPHVHTPELDRAASANWSTGHEYVLCTDDLRTLMQRVSRDGPSLRLLHTCGCTGRESIDPRLVTQALASPGLWPEDSNRSDAPERPEDSPCPESQ